MIKNKFVYYWMPVIIWAVLIFIVSSISTFPESIQPVISFDKFWHTVEYGILAFFLARAFKNSSREDFKRNFRLLAIIFTVFYAISDEFHQSFVPMRTASIIDVLFDSLGAVLGHLIVRK
ncbi:MAG: hypothetical protein GY853_11455 [PVC group bacterium]|nr:hypothetical protein [PVC group bacterium]